MYTCFEKKIFCIRYSLEFLTNSNSTKHCNFCNTSMLQQTCCLCTNFFLCFLDAKICNEVMLHGDATIHNCVFKKVFEDYFCRHVMMRICHHDVALKRKKDDNIERSLEMQAVELFSGTYGSFHLSEGQSCLRLKSFG